MAGAEEIRKYRVVILSFLISLLLFYEFIFLRYENNDESVERTTEMEGRSERASTNENFRASLSILGEWLRAPEKTLPPPKRKLANNNSSYLLILVWKYGAFLERRHIGLVKDWQAGCSVKNCRLSYRDKDLRNADAVIFHLHLTKSVREMPDKRGKPGQIWIFMTDESPFHTFLYNQQKISDYDNLFDWSMTYRSDSDVPVAYGRTIAKRRTKNLDVKSATIDNRYKLVAVMGSNCASKNFRWKYVGKLKRLLGDRLDIYGKCLGGNTTACPGHFNRDCPYLNSYKFYLAFENSNCREYITEKVYWNAYEKKSVPIIMGASRDDCQRLLPPRSFIHVDDYYSPTKLVNYLVYLDTNDSAYAVYHQWRSRYIVINEHGYFGSSSKHYCRVCEALSYNSPISIDGYNNVKYRFIENYWNSKKDCRNPRSIRKSPHLAISD